METSQNLRPKQIQLHIDNAGKGQEFVPMKRSQESFSPNFSLKVKASTCCLVSLHSVSVRRNLQVNLKMREERDTLK